MEERAALLICCSQEEAAGIREQAAREHRKVSSYLLSILMKSIEFEEALFARFHRLSALKLPANGIGDTIRGRPLASQPRTAMLLRCSREEGRRIRLAAKRRDASISKFVMFIVRRAWRIAEARRGTWERVTRVSRRYARLGPK
jgi:hypothetical protein